MKITSLDEIADNARLDMENSHYDVVGPFPGSKTNTFRYRGTHKESNIDMEAVFEVPSGRMIALNRLPIVSGYTWAGGEEVPF